MLVSSQNDTPSPEIPSVLDKRYLLKKQVGRGQCGSVLLGYDRNEDKEYAIKCVAMYRLVDKDRMRLDREISAMKRLHHPNIVQLHDVLTSPDWTFMVMEYFDGGDLGTYVERANGISESEARYFFQRIVAGVQYTHSNNICHRDLKLENVLMNKEKDRVAIGDFGLAIMDTSGLMKFRTQCGTPYYTAPEIMNYVSAYDGRLADSWSLGVMLYKMVTNTYPFKGDNSDAVRRAVRTQVPDYSKLSPELADLIQNLLVLDPKNRFNVQDIKTHPWFGNYEDSDILPLKDAETDVYCSGDGTSFYKKTDDPLKGTWSAIDDMATAVPTAFDLLAIASIEAPDRLCAPRVPKVGTVIIKIPVEKTQAVKRIAEFLGDRAELEVIKEKTEGSWRFETEEGSEFHLFLREFMGTTYVRVTSTTEIGCLDECEIIAEMIEELHNVTPGSPLI